MSSRSLATLTPSQALAQLGRWSQNKTTSGLSDVFEHFLLSLRSAHTRRNYAADIEAFLEYAATCGQAVFDVRDINETLVTLWLHSLASSTPTPKNDAATLPQSAMPSRAANSSVARRLAAVSSFLEFARKRGLVASNCAKLVSRPRIKRESKTNALTASQVQTLLTTASRQCENLRLVGGMPYRAARLRYVVVFTLLSVGMRVDELCELRIGDLEYFGPGEVSARLQMTTKGGETHAPLIHPDTARILQEYIKEARPHSGASDLLFTRAQNVRQPVKLTQAAVYGMLQRMAKDAGIDTKISPHSCRATLATLLHNSNVAIGQIQDLLGHKQLTTTAVYLKKAQEKEEAAALKIDLLNP